MGDELREVNGVSIIHKRPDEISQLLVCWNYKHAVLTLSFGFGVTFSNLALDCFAIKTEEFAVHRAMF